MGRKSKKEGIYVYIWMINFAVQAETDTAVQTNYTPKKQNKTSSKVTLLISGRPEIVFQSISKYGNWQHGILKAHAWVGFESWSHH